MNGLFLEIVEYIANSLLGVFRMDLAYFETAVPVSRDIFGIVIAVGWALLLGNLVFQAIRSMVSGLGFEGEDPSLLFARTFLFSFLLLVSRQICDIGLGITATVITMLQVPDSVQIPVLVETAFAIGASWLLVVIITVIILWQVVRMFFEVGERYVVTAVLTILSPLAFAMGGSKSTADIFKGWVRMFGSMCLMMILNVIFLKMLLSVLAIMPSGTEMLPWTILVMGIARVARKIDAIVARIGLNPAITGDGLGRSNLPGVLAFTVARSLGSTVAKTVGKSGGHTPPAGGSGRTFHGGTTGGMRGQRERSGTAPQNGFAAATYTSSAQSGPSVANPGTAHTAQTNSETVQTGAQNTARTAAAFSTAAQSTVNQSGASVSEQQSGRNSPNTQQSSSRRTAVSPSHKAGGGAGAFGRAGMAPQTRNTFADPPRGGAASATYAPAQAVRGGEHTSPGTAGTQTAAAAQSETTRFSAVPPTARQESIRGQAHSVTRQSSTSHTTAETRRTARSTSAAPPPAQGRSGSDRPAPGDGTAGSAGSKVAERPIHPGQTRTASPAQQERKPASAANAPTQAASSSGARQPEPRPITGGTAHPLSPARQESRPPSSTASPKPAAHPFGTAGNAPHTHQQSRPEPSGRPMPTTAKSSGERAARSVPPGGKTGTSPQKRPEHPPKGGMKRGR